ncbi:MAG TPA: NAD(P)H-hydrate dehydratase [Anaerolineaceae bacterium]|nr:NAD(P)H-hydrate dehydratase [Anaerolineaceae bacterium]
MAMKLVTVGEMRSIEQAANERGTTFADMMQKAGEGVALEIQKLFEDNEGEHIAVGLVGSGNNGGDALVALTALAGFGWKVRAYLLAKRTKSDPVWSAYSETHQEALFSDQDPDFGQLDDWIEDCNVLVDGVLGTGIKLPLKAEVGRVLGHVSKMENLPMVVAVDCPSGVDCDSGKLADETIPADLTVTMHAVKTGLLTFPAYKMVGELAVVDLGLPDDLAEDMAIRRWVVDEELVASWLPQRPLDAHKGTFGTAVVVAGSVNYTGAVYLASRAAYRIGAGLVQAAVAGPLQAALAGHLPEVTWILLPNELGVIAENAADVLLNNIGRATAILIGPGFGMEESTAAFMKRMFGTHHQKRAGIGFLGAGESNDQSDSAKLPPLVVDADGLKLLAKLPDWWKGLPAEAVLTPHPGEMAILTGLPTAEIQADRLGKAVEFARKWGHVVVLKGALSVIAAPDGRAAVIPVATAALAKAGTGDVLAGIIVGLRAQGLAAFEAACTGAWIHAQAGLEAAERIGSEAAVLAGDVLESIPTVLEDLE